MRLATLVEEFLTDLGWVDGIETEERFEGDAGLRVITEVKHGGAAMTAFARLQFEEMTEYEREAIKGGLKKYCELDKMAMVMIYEAWMDWLQ